MPSPAYIYFLTRAPLNCVFGPLLRLSGLSTSWKSSLLAARLFPCAGLIYTPQQGRKCSGEFWGDFFVFPLAVSKRDLRLRGGRWLVKAAGPRGPVGCTGKGRQPPRREERVAAGREGASAMGTASRPGPAPALPAQSAAVLKREQIVPRHTDKP